MHCIPRLAFGCAIALAATACNPGNDAATVDDPSANVGPIDVPPPVATPTPPPPAQPTTVPAPFEGTFASDDAACGSPGDPSQLTIGSETITFHESTGPITAVAAVGEDITVTAQLTGEGETREATYRFGLSDDGNTLTDLDGGMARVRCVEVVAGRAPAG